MNQIQTEVITLCPDQTEQAAKRAGEVLREGKIAAFPTDTVYGLGAVYDNKEAVQMIFEAKGRPEGKPLSILVSDISQVEELAEHIPDEARILMEAFWPGALTLIFRKNPNARIPEEVTAGGDTIGIRMPDSEIARRTICCAGKPVAAPSANASGKRSSSTAQEVLEDLNGRIHLLLDGGACPVGISSTVIDVSGDTWKILREGTITAQMMEKMTGKKIR